MVNETNLSNAVPEFVETIPEEVYLGSWDRFWSGIGIAHDTGIMIIIFIVVIGVAIYNKYYRTPSELKRKEPVVEETFFTDDVELIPNLEKNTRNSVDRKVKGFESDAEETIGKNLHRLEVVNEMIDGTKKHMNYLFSQRNSLLQKRSNVIENIRIHESYLENKPLQSPKKNRNKKRKNNKTNRIPKHKP